MSNSQLAGVIRKKAKNISFFHSLGKVSSSEESDVGNGASMS